MLPIIAIVGSPNVGKSSVFNALVNQRLSIVDTMPGTTRDRNYGLLQSDALACWLVDTGGLVINSSSDPMMMQVHSALQEAQLVLWIVDGPSGCTAREQAILQYLRRLGKPMVLVMNRCERLDALQVQCEFSSLGLTGYMVSAKQSIGIAELRKQCLRYVAADYAEHMQIADDRYPLKLTIIGRPNAGKSTLINALVAADRVVTSERPGTTTDALFIPVQYRSYELMLIDTAGIRRNKQAYSYLEKSSVEQAVRALRLADVVVMMIDGVAGLCEQDLKLIDKILQYHKPFIIAVNKIDCLDKLLLKAQKQQLNSRLRFFKDPSVIYISAKEQRGVGKIVKTAMALMKTIRQPLSTSQLNQILQQALADHPPPMVQGKRPKLRYVHLGHHQPFTVVIHGTGLDNISAAYQKYLVNYFRQQLKLQGVPMRLKWLEARRARSAATQHAKRR